MKVKELMSYLTHTKMYQSNQLKGCKEGLMKVWCLPTYHPWSQNQAVGSFAILRFKQSQTVPVHGGILGEATHEGKAGRQGIICDM